MLAYRLVYHGIGGRTVEELIEVMTYDEYITWAAFFSLEPRGDERADWHTAMVMAQQANMNRGKNTPRLPPSRFLARWEYKPKRKRTPEEMRDAAFRHFGLPLKGSPPHGEEGAP